MTTDFHSPSTKTSTAPIAGGRSDSGLEAADVALVARVRRPLAALLVGTSVANIAVVGFMSGLGWPAVLDEPGTVALRIFADNETAMVTGFYLFTLLSALLVPISLGFHRLTEQRGPLLAPTVTSLGILAGVFQILGWIRWPFAVPALARTYLDPASTQSVRDGAATSYDLLNAYAGGALGEHLGWLFQAAWGIGIAVLLLRTTLVSRAVVVTGGVLTTLWAVPFLLGNAIPALGAGLPATVGFTAYGLWFAWNAAAGISLLRRTR